MQVFVNLRVNNATKITAEKSYMRRFLVAYARVTKGFRQLVREVDRIECGSVMQHDEKREKIVEDFHNGLVTLLKPEQAELDCEKNLREVLVLPVEVGIQLRLMFGKHLSQDFSGS